MGIDTQIREQLARELANSDAPVLGSLVSDAATAGARRLSRQRYGFAAAGAAALAGVVVLGVFTVGYNRPAAGPTATSPAAGDGVSSAPPSLPTTPTASATSTSGSVATTGQRVVVLLRSLVHAKHVTEVDFGASDGNADGTFLYNDGHGAATVFASVSNQPAQYNTVGMDCPADEPGFTCTTRQLAGGNEARIMLMGPYGSSCTDKKCSLKDLRVEIKRPDGTYVIAEAYNGPQGHDRAATRPNPILDTNRLIAIATDSRWGLTSKPGDLAAAARSVTASGN
jgi:hypothetical protein